MRHFDLCVIGSGSGNSIIDERFDDWKVALVDGQEWFGGTCLNVGCIPTKMFVYPADLAESRPARPHGSAWTSARSSVRWSDVRDRVFGRIDPIVAGGEAYRRDSANVALYRERARFVAPKVLAVGDEQFSADRFVIAAGSRPRIPDVPGIDDPALADRIHTSDSIMRLAKLPKSLIIVGGGLVAVEFAHIFAAYGTQVTLLHRGQTLLRHEDEDVSRRFTDLLSRRVVLRLGQQLASRRGRGRAHRGGHDRRRRHRVLLRGRARCWSPPAGSPTPTPSTWPRRGSRSTRTASCGSTSTSAPRPTASGRSATSARPGSSSTSPTTRRGSCSTTCCTLTT